jgi:hypothetical protein
MRLPYGQQDKDTWKKLRPFIGLKAFFLFPPTKVYWCQLLMSPKRASIIEKLCKVMFD